MFKIVIFLTIASLLSGHLSVPLLVTEVDKVDMFNLFNVTDTPPPPTLCTPYHLFYVLILVFMKFLSQNNES